ncbi:hypothetical protein GFL57_28215 [Rhizobium leguminosarum bv. viciae]|nr:hypothetical protein [Rhizobium leguminosarum bv. viciae]
MADFSLRNSVWQLRMSNDEVEHLHQRLPDIHGLPVNHDGAYRDAIRIFLIPASALVQTVNAIGGSNGVNITGILQTQLVMVTPIWVSPFDLLNGIAKRLLDTLGIGEHAGGALIGAGVGLLAVGPAGVVIGGVAGFLATIGANSPHPGDVLADRDTAQAWEKFSLINVQPDKVALLSWRGFFCADNGGGQGVHANRDQVGAWETHRLFRNPNGTVSFQCADGNFLTAEGGGGGVCNWNRPAIGAWEQFWMEWPREHAHEGTFTLKTFQEGKYVSVQ